MDNYWVWLKNCFECDVHRVRVYYNTKGNLDLHGIQNSCDLLMLFITPWPKNPDFCGWWCTACVLSLSLQIKHWLLWCSEHRYRNMSQRWNWPLLLTTTVCNIIRDYVVYNVYGNISRKDISYAIITDWLCIYSLPKKIIMKVETRN